jgi:2'-5' RNA ligase
MRLFVAAQMPGDVAGELFAWGSRAVARDEALRGVPLESLHVTLVFLGTREPGDVEPVAGALARAVAGERWPEELAVGDVLWLAPRRPHVLTVAVQDPSGALGALQERLADELSAAIGFQPERRRFRPHVTVARVRRGRVPRTDGVGAPGCAGRGFSCAGVALMRSHLGGGTGARYETLAAVDGAGAAS